MPLRAVGLQLGGRGGRGGKEGQTPVLTEPAV